ncbi:MAG: hypothetical protein FJZ96_01805 [Chloroflexi bacterium]|nr:hypothetical protein [Chloroflexota bacterium]
MYWRALDWVGVVLQVCWGGEPVAEQLRAGVFAGVRAGGRLRGDLFEQRQRQSGGASAEPG